MLKVHYGLDPWVGVLEGLIQVIATCMDGRVLVVEVDTGERGLSGVGARCMFTCPSPSSVFLKAGRLLGRQM